MWETEVREFVSLEPVWTPLCEYSNQLINQPTNQSKSKEKSMYLTILAMARKVVMMRYQLFCFLNMVSRRIYAHIPIKPLSLSWSRNSRKNDQCILALHWLALKQRWRQSGTQKTRFRAGHFIQFPLLPPTSYTTLKILLILFGVHLFNRKIWIITNFSRC